MAAVKAVYSMVVSNQDYLITKNNIISLYEEDFKGFEFDRDFFSNLLEAVYNNKENLEKIIENNLSDKWSLNRISPVLLSILLVAVAEITIFKSNSYSAIINEYLNITHCFFDQEDVGFVNGILDKIKSNGI